MEAILDVANSNHRRRSPSGRDIQERRRSSPDAEDKHFDNGDLNGDKDESSCRLSEFNEGLSNRESPSLKFQWNRLLFESDPSRSSISSNQSAYHQTQYGLSSTRVTTERDYQSNRYPDISANTWQARTYSLNPNPIGVSTYSANLDYQSALSSCNLNVARELCKQHFGIKATEYIGTEHFDISKEDSHVSLNEGMFVPSDEYILSTENSEMSTTTSLCFDGYDQKLRIKYPELKADDMRDYSHTNFSPAERIKEDYIDLEGQRDMRDDMEPLCEEHGYRDLSTSIVGRSVERIDERDNNKERYPDISANTEQARTYSKNPNSVGVLKYSPNLDYRFADVRDDIESRYEEEHGYRDLSGTSMVDHTVDRIVERDSFTEQYELDLGNEVAGLEVQGYLHNDHLSHEEDYAMSFTGKNEYGQWLDRINAGTQEQRSNEPYASMLKPKRDIVKKSTRNKFLSNITSSDINNSIEGSPQKVNISLPRLKDSQNSEESKQLVNSAFLRYFKQLNENSAQRRSFTDRGKSGGLKCIVCGSDSKEFVDTRSLTAHAFGCQKIELRTKHLGFHKALCALMGWKSGMDFNKSWVYTKLSDAEALDLKEDLIIWPPVVIIHNSSIQNKNPAERIIVSIEELYTMLKGYVGSKASICRGKPANQSIIVVKFTSTLSGLEEAEKLHKYYGETKHGRSELQHVESSYINEEASKAEFVLFGYLGLAEDLDKLDFETKKRCFVKSKKEIQEIVNATLKSE